MQAEICERIAETLETAPIHDHLGYEALAYIKLPGPDYLKVLHTLHCVLEPKLYVEIGVRRGDSMKQALPETRVIGIDPSPSVGFRPNTVIASATSDEFFKLEVNREKCRGFDLALIDGDHSFDQALRDFQNLEALAKPTSIICLHDVIPMDERTAQPKSDGVSFHTGDVWKLMASLVATRQDLIAFTIATPPTGLGVVGRFGSNTRAAWFDWKFPSTWDEQVKFLNIIPNNADAVRAAFRHV